MEKRKERYNLRKRQVIWIWSKSDKGQYIRHVSTTKGIDLVKKDDDGKVAMCRVVARDFKPRRVGPRDDLCAAGVRENQLEQGQDDVKLMFTDVQKAHVNSKCEEEEWVELPNEFKNLEVCQAEEVFVRDEESSVRMRGRLIEKTCEWRVDATQSGNDNTVPLDVSRAYRNTSGVEEGTFGNVRSV